MDIDTSASTSSGFAVAVPVRPHTSNTQYRHSSIPQTGGDLNHEATFVGRTVNPHNGATRYWFEVTDRGETFEYAIQESSDQVTVIHASGEPVENEGLANQIKGACFVELWMKTD